MRYFLNSNLRYFESNNILIKDYHILHLILSVTEQKSDYLMRLNKSLSLKLINRMGCLCKLLPTSYQEGFPKFVSHHTCLESSSKLSSLVNKLTKLISIVILVET